MKVVKFMKAADAFCAVFNFIDRNFINFTIFLKNEFTSSHMTLKCLFDKSFLNINHFDFILITK
jgi:hypothetical protein